MAFPTTISSLVVPYHGVGGPFVSVAGNVYVLTRNSTANELHMFKATDPASSFAGAGTDFAMSSGNTIRHVAAYQVADLIHVATRDAAAANSNQIRYHVFNMATDVWDTTNELVKTTYTQKGAVDDSNVTITVRSAGAVLVMYEGPQVLADVQRARTYYARRISGTWSADIALDNAGNNDWYPQEAVLGLSNRVHFFFLNNTGEDLYQRTLDSANALEAFPAAFDSILTSQNDLGHQRAVVYSASAGGTIVRYPYYNSFAPDLNDVRFSSADAPTPLTITTDITGAVDPAGGAHRRKISLAVDENTVYGVFADTVQDLYVMSSQDAGAWSVPSLIYTGSADTVFANVYTRASNRVIGIVFYESEANLRYTEYTLSAASAAAAQPLFGMLLGVGS